MDEKKALPPEPFKADTSTSQAEEEYQRAKMYFGTSLKQALKTNAAFFAVLGVFVWRALCCAGEWTGARLVRFWRAARDARHRD